MSTNQIYFVLLCLKIEKINVLQRNNLWRAKKLKKSLKNFTNLPLTTAFFTKL